LRTLAGASDEVRLEAPYAEHFEAGEDCIPSAAPVPIPKHVDFRSARPLGDVALNDCVTGRIDRKPTRLVYPASRITVTLDIDPAFEQLVLYAPPGKPFFAVEPVTNANDGFNLFERGIRGSGVFVLAPGEERSATFTLSLNG